MKSKTKDAVLMIVLLIFNLFFSVNLSYATGENIITVDDDRKECPDADYTSIQDAIDNASSGDTIYVYSGIYYENIVIDKSIDLIGENKNTTIIDGKYVGNVVYISSDWVNISGFTIQNSDIKDEYDAGVRASSNYIRITENIISNNDIGIELYNYSSNNIISGNIILNNSFGIELTDSSSNNTIIDNIISGNYDGIVLHPSSNNTISSNNISSNDDDGIYVDGSSKYNIISNNNIRLNNEQGIYIYESTNNAISGNYISSNKYDGVYLYYASNNTVVGNYFYKNGFRIYDSYYNNVESNMVNDKPLVYLENKSNEIIKNAGQAILVKCDNIIIKNQNLSNATVGVELWETCNSKITDNCLSNNFRGIEIFVSSSNNTISDNIISNNCQGIYLYKHSNNNFISDNIISYNDDGIYIYYSCSNNAIYHNNFINNTANAYDGCKNNVWYNITTERGNYWSNYTGRDSNGDGIGDTPYRISKNQNITDKYPVIKPFELTELENKRTPGFELILVLCTIVLILFWKRKIVN